MKVGLLALLGLAALLLAGCKSRLPWDRPPPSGSWRIEGHRTVSREDLTKAAWYEIDAMNKGEHRLADAYDAAYAMERHLRLEGYPDAAVRFEGEAQGEILFRVEEGARALMGHVRLEGVRAFPTATFLPHFEPPASGWMDRGPRWYTDSRVRGAVAKVESHYRLHGYRDVEVGPPEASWNAARSAMDVRVPVVEGPKYVIASVTIVGDRADLVDRTAWQGQPFHATSAIEIASAIRKRLADGAYVYADVEIDRDIDEERHTAALTFEVNRGEKQRLGTVVIPKGLRTRTGFIRKRIPIRDGDLLTRRNLAKGLTDVYGTGAFSTMNHELVPRGSNTSDLVLELEEADAKRVDLGIGWGSWEMLRGTATWHDFNFMGRGRYFRATALASIRHQGIDGLVEDPWILGDRNLLSGRVALFHREERFYKFWGIEAELFVERELSDHWKIRGGYSFEARDAFDVDPGLSGSDLAEVEGFSRSAGLFVRARWDRRDHLFLPTTGWITDATVRWSTPALGANLHYVEVRLRHSHYFDLGRGGVLALHNHAATKEVLDDEILPIQERYFLGGAESVRCYGYEELTPVDPNGQGFGGLSAYEGSLEWRKRIAGDLFGAVFVDWGMVAVLSFDFDGAWGWGPGLGIRYYTPVGPIRLDVAWNPGDWYAATQAWQFHFAFGFSF